MTPIRSVLVTVGVAFLVLAASGTAPAKSPVPGAPQPLNLLDPNFRWVVAHPHIYNIFWDDKWTRHNSWSRHDVDLATKRIVDNGYFDKLAQYGVSSPSWQGSHSPSVLCQPRRAPKTVSFPALLKWMSCEVSTLFSQSRFPVSDDLFVLYLPERTTIVDGPSIGSFSILGHAFPGLTVPLFTSCADYDGYHFFSMSVTGPFAYAIVPAACAKGSLDALTTTASHELVEAATDPIVTQGWIDDAFSIAPPAFERLLKGEAGDICSSSGTKPTQPASLGQPPVSVARYWSNSDGACKP